MKRINKEFNFYPDFSRHLNQDFFLRETSVVANDLIGKVLVKQHKDGNDMAGIITETEAYLSENDMSSHSFPGLTKRNAAMFETGGILYVYKIYGIHLCINIVTEIKGKGCAVLMRAVKPILGIDKMKEYRNSPKVETLTKGPGNLTKAFNFSIEDNFKSVCTKELFIQDAQIIKPEHIKTTERIGITKSKELMLRYVI